MIRATLLMSLLLKKQQQYMHVQAITKQQVYNLKTYFKMIKVQITRNLGVLDFWNQILCHLPSNSNLSPMPRKQVGQI